MHVDMHTPLWDMDFVSFGYVPRSGTVGSGNSFVILWETLVPFFQNDCRDLHSLQQCTRVPFSLWPCQYFLSLTFDPSRCEVISYCGFNLHFPYDYWSYTTLRLPIGRLYVFKVRNVCSGPLTSSVWVCNHCEFVSYTCIAWEAKLKGLTGLTSALRWYLTDVLSVERNPAAWDDLRAGGPRVKHLLELLWRHSRSRSSWDFGIFEGQYLLILHGG